MEPRRLFSSTIRFPDVVPLGSSVATHQDEEMLVRRLPKPSSAVLCALSTRLLLPHCRPNAIVRRLDVSEAVLFVEHAIPDESLAWLELPTLPPAQVDGRVVRTMRREPGACWIAKVTLTIRDDEIRRRIATLMRALKYDQAQRVERA